MNCPFCDANLIEGYLICPNCRKFVIDFNYFENMNKMEEKYSKSGLLELSKEKLTFQEIITIYTFIERLNHHCGEDSVSDECGQDEINSNLAKRIAEIRNESNF